MTYFKDFKNWHILKESINTANEAEDRHAPTFQEREIWWCSVGVNVGVEEDGKNTLFERPVLVIRKFNRRLFWAVPLTSQLKDYPFHFTIHFKGVKEKEPKERQAILSQLRSYDSARLLRHLGKLPQPQFKTLLQALHDTLDGPNKNSP